MGVDINSLNLLSYAAKKRSLGDVASIGRARIFLTLRELADALGFPAERNYGAYCEKLLLEHFGARTVHSFDNSEYEGATHIFDFNAPITIERTYDTVIDFGTLEHIYNVPQALKTISMLAVEGGQILHVLSANNQCGHGFWQFSPELFFSLYSQTNGYVDTEVFLAEYLDPKHWYRVHQPDPGYRVEITSRWHYPVFILVRTVRGSAFSHHNVQQSDYVDAWQAKAPGAPHDQRVAEPGLVGTLKNIIKRNPEFSNRVRRLLNPHPLSNRNPHVTKIEIAALLSDE